MGPVGRPAPGQSGKCSDWEPEGRREGALIPLSQPFFLAAFNRKGKSALQTQSQFLNITWAGRTYSGELASQPWKGWAEVEIYSKGEPSPHRDGALLGPEWDPCRQAGHLCVSEPAAPERLEGGSAGCLGENPAGFEGSMLPWWADCGPRNQGAEGGEGERMGALGVWILALLLWGCVTLGEGSPLPGSVCSSLTQICCYQE